MKIITNKKQQRALTIVTKLRKALFSENTNEKFIAIIVRNGEVVNND